ncbi:hypothetical protein [Photobacterium lutimaris]|uniref:Uncharacterized protein n=1 Tax=Photobacterium lutimaris TaxID=388278 RepID=A0A2T3ITS2_9GAMM|nr:hypothetical protein [Photobacterium lutimaris]PSU31766.1 hypothetical protein C9I99_21520 [Photobacterium lutimaris]TDR72583.1 hypothetical protein DFP78_11359 [Photobacterium lutimaris]
MKLLDLHDVLFVSLYEAYSPTNHKKSDVSSILKKYATSQRCRHIKSDIKKVLQAIKKQKRSPVREVESVLTTLNQALAIESGATISDVDQYWWLVRDLDKIGAPTFAQEPADFDKSMESRRPLIMHSRMNEMTAAFDDNDQLVAPLNFVYYADNIYPLVGVLQNNEHFTCRIQSNSGRHNITIATKHYPIDSPQVCIEAFELQSAKASLLKLYRTITDQGFNMAYIGESELTTNHVYVNRTHEAWHFDHNGDQVEPVDIMVVGETVEQLKTLASTVEKQCLFLSYNKIYEDTDQATMLIRLNPAYYKGHEQMLEQHCKL